MVTIMIDMHRPVTVSVSSAEMNAVHRQITTKKEPKSPGHQTGMLMSARRDVRSWIEALLNSCVGGN